MKPKAVMKAKRNLEQRTTEAVSVLTCLKQKFRRQTVVLADANINAEDGIQNVNVNKAHQERC